MINPAMAAAVSSTGLIVIDAIAELLDPHPDNMGPWYKRYFHRLWEGDDE